MTRWIFALLVLSSPALGQHNFGQPTESSSTFGCAAMENKDEGTVIFGPGCTPSMMEVFRENARRKRTPNAGDFEVLSQKLDRIIQLLEAQGMSK